MAQSREEVESWLRDQGVDENIIKQEAGYIADRNPEDVDQKMRESLGGLMQRTQSGGDRDEGGYSTDENDPAWGKPGEVGYAAARTDSAKPVSGGSSSGGNSMSGTSVSQAWNSQPVSAPSQPSWYEGVIKDMLAKQAAAEAERKQRADSLFSTLSQKAGQSLNINRNDPIIRAQADAYAANEERAKREHLNDLAERAGPTANLLGEERLAAERLGQRTGSFEAKLLGDELTARRAEILEMLKMQGALLSEDQQVALQQQLAAIDAAIAEQGMGVQMRGQDIQSQLGNRGLDVDWERALLQNQQFMNRLGFDAEDRASYWDSVRRGIL